MKNIYEIAKQVLPADCIDHHDSDLYLKVTNESKKLVKDYDFRFNVETFVSALPPHDLWFDIPFAYTPYWEGIRRYTPVVLPVKRNIKG